MTFRDCAAADLDRSFFNGTEHASRHKIDGRDALVILDESAVKEHNSHWEAGAKTHFDTGTYNAKMVLYIQAEDYGPKPKAGKLLVMDAGTDHKRTYTILQCSDEAGVFRMTLERVRQ